MFSTHIKPLRLLDQAPSGPHIWLRMNEPDKGLKRVIVFDRDSTLIRDAGQDNRLDNLEFLPGAIDSLKLCFISGYEVAVITNQAGISKGLFDLQTLDIFNQELNIRILREAGKSLVAIIACPHQAQDLCNCRKPKSGMIEELRKMGDFQIEAFFGDAETDMQAAQAAFIAGIRVEEKNLFREVRKWVSDSDSR